MVLRVNRMTYEFTSSKYYDHVLMVTTTEI